MIAMLTLQPMRRFASMLAPQFRAGAAEWPANSTRQVNMTQFVVLAALLHALLVAMFGNTQGGTARPGAGVWGPINVTLRGQSEQGIGPVLPPKAYSGPTGAASERRFGGAVRDEREAPRSNDGPGAARLGVWSSTPSPSATEVAPGALAPLLMAPSDVSTMAPSEPAQIAPLARVVPAAAMPRAQPTPGVAAATVAPEPKAAPQTNTAQPSIAERVAPRNAESRPSDIPRAAPMERDARLKMVQSPPAPALAEPMATVPPLLASNAALSERTTEAQIQAAPMVSEVKTLSIPARVASVSAPAQRLPALPVESASLPTVAEAPAAPRAQLDSPVEIKALPTLPTPAISADASGGTARTQPLETAPRAPGLVVPNLQTLPAVSGTVLAAPRAVVAAPTSGAAAAAPDGSRSATATATTVPQPSIGAPDAGPGVGRDVATAPSAPASAPRLNLDLPRTRGGETARESSRGVLQLLPHPPERKSKLAEDIAKAAKKDCKDAYGGMGILAAIPLALDAVKSHSATGCKW